MTIFTIGFAKKTAARFFGLLRDAQIERLIDVRILPNSQLSSFARGVDLPFLLRELAGAAYEHRAELAPTVALLRDYRSGAVGWDDYAALYVALLAERRIESALERSTFAKPTVLLCSEPTAARCHRRLLVDYLAERWGAIARIDL